MWMSKIHLSSVSSKDLTQKYIPGGGGANNASRGEYPQTRTFSFGTNITFYQH